MQIMELKRSRWQLVAIPRSVYPIEPLRVSTTPTINSIYHLCTPCSGSLYRRLHVSCDYLSTKVSGLWVPIYHCITQAMCVKELDGKHQKVSQSPQASLDAKYVLPFLCGEGAGNTMPLSKEQFGSVPGPDNATSSSKNPSSLAVM